MVVLELPKLKERERTNQKEVNRAYDEKRKNEEQSAAVWILKIEETPSFDIHECLFVLVGSGGEEEPDDDWDTHGDQESSAPIEIINESHDEHEEANLVDSLEYHPQKHHIELFLSSSIWIPLLLATRISTNTAQD